MTQPVLLLDDGELEDVADVLVKAGVPFERLRGGQIQSRIPPPLDLLVTTPRRAGAVRRGSPPTARTGRPLRVIVSKEDSGAMRGMLRRMGFHLLVRRPTHPETWRLLIQRALSGEQDATPQPGERRLTARRRFSRSVAAEGPRGSHVLMGRDLSEGGMRIHRMPGVELGQRFTLAIFDPSHAEPMRIEATVVRDDLARGFALRFENVDASSAQRLEKLVASLPDVECLEDGEAANLGTVVAEVLPDGGRDSVSADCAGV